MANRLTVEQVLSPSRSKESEQRCMTRLEDPPEVCRQLLIDLREGPALWQGLRKHLTVEDSEFILRVLQEHSDWRVVKKGLNERLQLIRVKQRRGLIYLAPVFLITLRWFSMGTPPKSVKKI